MFSKDSELLSLIKVLVRPVLFSILAVDLVLQGEGCLLEKQPMACVVYESLLLGCGSCQGCPTCQKLYLQTLPCSGRLRSPCRLFPEVKGFFCLEAN